MKRLPNSRTSFAGLWLALLLASLQSIALSWLLLSTPAFFNSFETPAHARARELQAIAWEQVNSDATLAQYMVEFSARAGSSDNSQASTSSNWLSGAQLLFGPRLGDAGKPELTAAARVTVNPDCVQVVLPEEADAKRAVFSLFGRFRQHPFKTLNWCFTGHWDIATTATHSGARIRFSPTPRAYAKARDIYLPATASVDLLAHELAHIAGLADEYAMRPELAAPFCEGRYRHPSLNVVVTDREVVTAAQLQQLWQRLPWRSAVADWRALGAPLQQNGQLYWRLGSSDPSKVGLFAVPTCKTVGKFAWRPVAQTTAMQHFDVPHWPALYLTLMQNYLAEQFNPAG